MLYNPLLQGISINFYLFYFLFAELFFQNHFEETLNGCIFALHFFKREVLKKICEVLGNWQENNSQINLVYKLNAFTFALPLKNGAFFGGKKK